MRNLYISDTHFFHNNIIAMDDRPWSSVEYMHRDMRERWNKNVTKGDHVYIIGDFVWQLTPESIDYIKSLNGNLHLIIGNHDKFIKNNRFKNLFCEITHYKVIKDTDGQETRNVILNHYYMPFYDKHYYGGILIHGHSHMTQESYAEREITKELSIAGYPLEIYNVSCMYPYMDYAPKTLKEIIEGYNKWSKGLK